MLETTKLDFDNLIAGVYPRADKAITVEKDTVNGVMKKGTVLSIKANGKCAMVDKSDAGDLKEVYCILAEDINVTASDITSFGYLTGDFFGEALVFKTGNTLEDFKIKLRNKSIFVR